MQATDVRLLANTSCQTLRVINWVIFHNFKYKDITSFFCCLRCFIKPKTIVMKYLLLLLLIPQYIVGQVDQKDFKIKVELSTFNVGEKFYLEYNNTSNSDNAEITDSVVSNTNTFTFKGKIGEPVPATLYRYKEHPKDFLEGVKKLPQGIDEEMQEYLSKPMKEGYKFFLVPGEITISSKRSLAYCSIIGPQAVVDFNKLKNEDQAFFMKGISFADMIKMGSDKEDEAFMQEMRKKMDSLDKKKKDQVYLSFVRKNPSSPVALHALKESVSNKIDSADKYIEVFSLLPSEMQQWPSAAKFIAVLKASRNAEIGKMVKDFSQWDSLGEVVKFSSYKGRYVLLDLWASWCVPCRKKHPELLKIYNKYSQKNFTILGVALEEKEDRNKWLKAIQQDKLLWTQVTDFKSWNNAVAREFGVRSIPFNLLVDPDGKIIDKNLSGADLENRLAELFKISK